MLMFLFPNTLLAWAFTGNKFSLTCSLDSVSITILLWGVRDTFIDSHFILSNSHTAFAGKDFFYPPAQQTQAGTWDSTWFFFWYLLLSTLAAARLLVIPAPVCKVTKCSVHLSTNVSLYWCKCNVVFVKRVYQMTWQLFLLTDGKPMKYWWNNEIFANTCKYLPCKFYFPPL